MPKRKARRPARAQAWRARLRALVAPAAWLDPWLGAALALLVLVALEPYVWLGQLAAELRLQLALLAVPAALWAAWCRRWLRGTGLALGALLLAWPLGPYLRAARPTPQHGPVLELVQLHQNDAPGASAALSALLRAQRPHVVSLTGVRRAELSDAAGAATGYRRLPHALQSLLLVRNDLPAAPIQGNTAASVRVGSCSLGLTQLGLPSLFSAPSQPERAALLGELARLQLGPRHLLVGAFGSRADAADLQPVMAVHGLRDARLGHGVLASAPGALGPLGLPTDQVLVRGWILVREARALPAPVPGSHRGLFLALELTEPRCALQRPLPR